MYVGRKEIKLLVDEIKGDELLIRQILEKYHIGERDYDKILDKIEKIERNTIKLQGSSSSMTSTTEQSITRAEREDKLKKIEIAI